MIIRQLGNPVVWLHEAVSRARGATVMSGGWEDDRMKSATGCQRSLLEARSRPPEFDGRLSDHQPEETDDRAG
jgi:hypothetical protein